MRKSAFTLAELLVVIGIIVVLVAILLPSLNRAWQAAQFVDCQSNLRQFGVATHMYVNDNQGYLPFSNWNPDGFANVIGYCNATVGWLYACPMTSSPDCVQTGTFWPYLNHEGVYHCPAHIPGDAGNYVNPSPTANPLTDVMTSYMMNGAVNGYGATVGSSNGGLPSALYLKIIQFDSQDALMWESAEQDPYGWNDGATLPWESYNPSGPQGIRTRHGYYFSLLSMDGHVEGMSTKDYWTLASATTENRLWCCPTLPNGGAGTQ